MNSSGICPAAAISAKAASMPISVPMKRHMPLPITAPWLRLITSSTVDAAE